MSDNFKNRSHFFGLIFSMQQGESKEKSSARCFVPHQVASFKIWTIATTSPQRPLACDTEIISISVKSPYLRPVITNPICLATTFLCSLGGRLQEVRPYFSSINFIVKTAMLDLLVKVGLCTNIWSVQYCHRDRWGYLHKLIFNAKQKLLKMLVEKSLHLFLLPHKGPFITFGREDGWEISKPWSPPPQSRDSPIAKKENFYPPPLPLPWMK